MPKPNRLGRISGLILAITLCAVASRAQAPAAPTVAAPPSAAPTAISAPTAAPTADAPAASPASTPAASPSAKPTTPASPRPTPTPAATPLAGASPAAAIPLSELVSRAESAAITVRGIDADLMLDPIINSSESEISSFTREVGARVEDNAHVIAADPSLDTLRGMQRQWQQQKTEVDAWATRLTDRAMLVDHEVAQLGQLNATWQLTLTQARDPNLAAPYDIVTRIEGVITSIAKTRKLAAQQRAHLLELQNIVVDQQARVTDAIAAVAAARQEAVNRLFTQDSPPIWSAEAYNSSGQAKTDPANGVLTLAQQTGASFTAQATAVSAYAQREQSRFLLHGLIVLILAALLFRVRSRIREMAKAEAEIERAARIFETPVATALVLSLLACPAIYSQAPRALWALLGATALLPTIWILRRLVERPLYPILNSLMIFYFADQIRTVAAALPLPSRLLLTGELLGGVLFLSLAMRSGRLNQVLETNRDRIWRAAHNGTRVALIGLLVALLAAIVGYVSLANLLGDALLRSAYLAILLYALEHIVAGMVLITLHAWPLTRLGFVQRNRDAFARYVHRTLVYAGMLLWLLRTLDSLVLLAPAMAGIRAILTATLRIGSFDISLGRLLAFGITVWASFFISRVILFLLEEDIYPRVSLARGLPYAISTLLHYVILLIGFFMAVSAMGIDMNRFTILAGAFGVGLGFGMQNIVNNFVSGLILLFERPVKVGDVIQFDDAQGVVESIGIRASIIRTTIGSEIIVPNGNLISNRVTNWTYSNNQRSLTLPVTIASAGIEPKRIMDLMVEIAKAHPLVTKEPAPTALFTKFGATSMDFELRAWTDCFEVADQVRSDLAVAISDRLGQEKIVAA